jgi:hypothetical protein
MSAERPSEKSVVTERHVVAEPIGVTYCTTHHGLREADEDRGCAWQDDEPEQACQFVELYRGTEVVDTYLDPAYKEDETDGD